MRTKSNFIVTAIAAVLSLLPMAAHASCSIQITSVYQCDATGKHTQWKVGDPYFIRVNWNVTGTPAAPYYVDFQEANLSYQAGPVQPGSGNGYWMYAGFTLPLDETVPYTVTVDSTNVTGNIHPKLATRSGTFQPALPAKAVAYYDPVTLDGSETFDVNWVDGSGDVTKGYTLLGVPTTGTFQKVDSLTGPAGGVKMSTSPTGDPVWQTNFAPFSPVSGDDIWDTTESFTVTESSERGNPNLMNAITWAQVSAAAPKFKGYLGPDTLTQSTDPAITAYVASVLPAGYQSSMTPYQAARALYLAVDKDIAYEDAQSDVSAVATLQGGTGNCAGMSDLYDACLRSIGIPARMDCGFWTGTDQWHCFTEFYLPGCGWIPADTSEDRLWWDQSGTYAFLFGSDPPLNGICAVSRTTLHKTAHWNISDVQVGYFYYWGTAGVSGISDTSSL